MRILLGHSSPGLRGALSHVLAHGGHHAQSADGADYVLRAT